MAPNDSTNTSQTARRGIPASSARCASRSIPPNVNIRPAARKLHPMPVRRRCRRGNASGRACPHDADERQAAPAQAAAWSRRSRFLVHDQINADESEHRPSHCRGRRARRASDWRCRGQHRLQAHDERNESAERPFSIETKTPPR